MKRKILLGLLIFLSTFSTVTANFLTVGIKYLQISANPIIVMDHDKKINYPDRLDITNNFKKLHIQERNLSCEVAASSDILTDIFDKDMSEKDLLALMKKDSTYGKALYIDSNGEKIWGDPDNGFVGKMDGHQYALTGYAVYEQPLSEIYDYYGLTYYTYNKFDNNLGFLDSKEAIVYFLKEIYKGNYVQLWGDYCTDPRYEDGNTDEKISTSEALNGKSQKNYCYSFNQPRMITWKTPAGKEITAAKQSHNFILLGYTGDINNPETIIVWDTQTGKHEYPLHERLRKWELNGSRAIVIKKDEF